MTKPEQHLFTHSVLLGMVAECLQLTTILTFIVQAVYLNINTGGHTYDSGGPRKNRGGLNLFIGGHCGPPYYKWRRVRGEGYVRIRVIGEAKSPPEFASPNTLSVHTPVCIHTIDQ